jgi:hypothetical protein
MLRVQAMRCDEMVGIYSPRRSEERVGFKTENW